ncbi:MAG TPA: lipopolysaccharide biosynthesis protein [Xenococcaceae cyanobacterium]
MNISVIRAKFSDLWQKSLVKDAFWAFIAKLCKIFAQTFYFIVIARVLGATDYGSFIGVTSLASIVYPFIAFGSEHLLVKYVAVNQSLFRTYWGNSLLVLIINSFLITAILVVFAPLFFNVNQISQQTIILILLADLLCLGLLDLGFKALISVNLVKKTALLGIFSAYLKLLAALCLAVFVKNPTATNWSWLYFISGLITGIVAVLLVNHLVATPKPILSKIKSEIGQGIYFSIGFSANNINNSLDKTMLASMSTLEATGIYGSAYRFITMGHIPVLALFEVAYTRFFRHGAAGINSSLNFAKQLLPYMAGYAVISILGYELCAPLIPKILGQEYQDAIAALRWLSPLPALFAFQLLGADTLTGAGFQKIRSWVQVVSAILNIGLNWWLIPIYSWKGAAWATLAADSLRVATLWLMVWFLSRKANQGTVSSKQ